MRKGLQVIALFGDPVERSLSPVIHNAAFAALNLDYTYLPFRADASSLPALFSRLRQGNLAGANFTYPCKEAALALCDHVSPEVSVLKAANAAKIEPEGIAGHNADAYGFSRMLEEIAVSVSGQDVLVLGAGAAARACGLALAEGGAAVTYATRHGVSPEPLIPSDARVIPLAQTPAFLTSAAVRLLVNATPVGLRDGDEPLFRYETIPTSCAVIDLNYGRRTALLDDAARRGLRCFDGLPMLIHQGARVFEIWTDVTAPVDVMRAAAAAEIAKREL